MNSDTATAIPAELNGGETIHRVAQKAHVAVDKLEQSVGAGTEKVLSLHQEYGDLAREQVKASPLLAIGAAFAAGIVFSKIFMR